MTSNNSNPINRRDFLERTSGWTATLASAPLLAPASVSMGQAFVGNPTGVVEAMSSLASDWLRPKLKPGPGFAARQGGDLVQWSLFSSESSGQDGWRFEYRTGTGLRSTCALQLDRSYRVAEMRVRFTNSPLGVPAKFSELYPLFLRIGGAERPVIQSCTGAGSSSYFPHMREFPPDAFRPRWIQPIYPRTVEFASHRQVRGYPTGDSRAPAAARQRGFGERWTGSSSQDLPLFLLSPGPDSRRPGLFFGLEWSTFWIARIFYDGSPADLRIEVGPTIHSLVLEPGESLDLPVVHLGFFDEGLEAGSNALRRYIQERLTLQYRGKPMVPAVAYTLWPGMSVTYSEEELRRHAGAAADLGVEMFCVDADWYTGGHSRGRGNWEVDPEKFPNGLRPFSEFVRSKGMGLGLYFEAVAFSHTRLAREHPEHFYQLPDGFFPLKYNFSSPEACDHWIELISGFVERYDLRFIRADFYTDPMRGEESFHWERVEEKGKTRFAHVQGLYRVWETLTSRHPRLMLELNAGGGNAIDLGSLRRHHCAWLNDSSGDPHSCRMMQLGANTFLPPSYLGLAVGKNRDGPETGLDVGFSDLSFLSRMCGQLLLHGALADWPQEVSRRARHWVGVYKRIRPLLVKDYYRLLPPPQSDAAWDAAQFCDGSERGVVFMFRYAGLQNLNSIVLRSLDADRRYLFEDEGSGERRMLTGEEVLTEGLKVRLAPNSARLFSYHSV